MITKSNLRISALAVAVGLGLTILTAQAAASTVGITLPGTGAAFPLPVYGRINKTSAAAMASGTYTHVTLSW